VSESTYAPGTTRKIVMPIIEQAVGRGRVAFGYSPERIDPGNERFGLSDIPKVTSGADEAAASLTTAFYRELVDDVVPASSMEAAEATKLLENTFRFVNIAFAHEFDDYCHALGMSAREITGLASTKPFGFMPFFAGPGVGGHCIAEDPYYLYDSMIAAGVPTAIIETAMVNQDERASVIVGRIQAHLGERPLQGARVLVMGVTYKPNVADTRRSPAVPVIDLLEAAGAQVDYHDPHVPSFHGRSSVDLVGAAQRYDVVAFITEHSVFDPDGMAAQGCNVFRVSGGSPAARSAAA
jgi:UDP-N-acetyl-D-glucosamine dehydrogenase